MKAAAAGLFCVLFLSLSLRAADKPKKGRPADNEQKSGDDKKTAAGNMRTWADETGKIKVKAKFVALKDGKVTLETDEGKTVELAIDKLSASDQKVSRNLAKEAAENPFKAGDSTAAAGSSGGDKAEMSVADWSKVKKIAPEQIDKWSVKPDPAPALNKSLTLQPISLTAAAGSNSEGGQNSLFASIDGLLFDQSRGQALAVIHDAAPGRPVVNKIQRVDLISGKTSQPITYPSVMKPVDVDSTGSTIVARTDFNFSGRPDFGIGVWELGEERIRHIRSWNPIDPGEFMKDHLSLAKFIDSDHVMTLSFNKLTMWQVSKARAVYKIEIGSGGAVALSPGKKYLAAALHNGLFVFDALNGKTVGSIPGETGGVTALSFRPDGRRLAAVAAQRLFVWDLEKGETHRDVHFAQGLPYTSIEWIGNGHLLVGGERAFDIEKRIVLWQYLNDASAGISQGYGQALDHYWYVVTSQNRKERGLYHVKLPHEDALKAAAALDPEKLLAVRPGATVALNVTIQGTPAEQQQVHQELSAQLKTLGINVAASSPLVLHATTEAGKTQEITYKSLGGGGVNEKVNVTNQISHLKFVENGTVLWKSAAITDASPMMVNIKQGQSIQDALAPYQKPDLKYYSNVKLPQYVVRPSEMVAQGASSLTAQGIKSAKVRPAKSGVAGR